MTSNYGGTVAEGSKALAAIWSENKLKPKDLGFVQSLAKTFLDSILHSVSMRLRSGVPSSSLGQRRHSFSFKKKRFVEVGAIIKKFEGQARDTRRVFFLKKAPGQKVRRHAGWALDGLIFEIV